MGIKSQKSNNESFSYSIYFIYLFVCLFIYLSSVSLCKDPEAAYNNAHEMNNKKYMGD